MIDLQIIIPTYNRADKIIDTIDSVLRSAEKFDFIIKIIDNASTDETASLIKSNYKDLIKEKIIHFLSYDINIPMVENWNRCISAMEEASYTKLLWSDDCLDANYFTSKIRIIEKLNCDIVGCNLRIINSDTSRVITRSYGGNLLRSTSLFRNRIGYPSTLLFRTNILKDRFFDENIPYTADIDHTLHLLKCGAKLSYTNTVLVEAKQDSSTETSKFFGSDLMKIERRTFRSKHINSKILMWLANLLDALSLKIYIKSKNR